MIAGIGAAIVVCALFWLIWAVVKWKWPSVTDNATGKTIDKIADWTQDKSALGALRMMRWTDEIESDARMLEAWDVLYAGFGGKVTAPKMVLRAPLPGMWASETTTTITPPPDPPAAGVPIVATGPKIAPSAAADEEAWRRLRRPTLPELSEAEVIVFDETGNPVHKAQLWKSKAAQLP